MAVTKDEVRDVFCWAAGRRLSDFSSWPEAVHVLVNEYGFSEDAIQTNESEFFSGVLPSSNEHKQGWVQTGLNGEIDFVAHALRNNFSAIRLNPEKLRGNPYGFDFDVLWDSLWEPAEYKYRSVPYFMAQRDVRLPAAFAIPLNTNKCHRYRDGDKRLRLIIHVDWPSQFSEKYDVSVPSHKEVYLSSFQDLWGEQILTHNRRHKYVERRGDDVNAEASYYVDSRELTPIGEIFPAMKPWW